MGDFYKRRDVQALLKHRKILFIGDSSVRPLYKDLIKAIKHKELISVETLKNPNVDSYFGDIAIQQSGRKHEWAFWENRIFEEGPWRIEMFFTGVLMMREIQQYIFKLSETPSSVPDIVYISYKFAYGKNTHSMNTLLVNLKMKLPCNTLVLVGSSFPTTRDMFGDPRFDEVPFFSTDTLSREDGIEEEIVRKILSLGFHHLNISHYLRRSIFRGVTMEPGWESIIVRYTTFLLLTYIANSLRIKTPNRVNQDVLRRALSSGNYEGQLYNDLILKSAIDWFGVKSNALTEEIDLAASNAHEITQMLWKVYHRPQGRSSPKEITKVSKTKLSRHGRENHDKKNSNSAMPSPKPGSSKGKIRNTGSSKVTDSSLIEPEASSSFLPKGADVPRQTSEQQGKDTKKQECTHEILLTAAHRKSDALKRSPQVENPSPLAVDRTLQGDENTIINIKDDTSDEESLEEGEIRESPLGSPKGQGGIQVGSNVTVISDISSSEGELDMTPGIPEAGFEQVVLPGVSSYHQYYQHHPSIYGYQNYHAQNYQIQVPTCSAEPPPEQVQCTDLTCDEPVEAVDVSDEEPSRTQEENPSRNNAYEAIIRLYSDESGDGLSSCSERSDGHEKRNVRKYKHEGKDKLCLLKEEGTSFSWPTAIARRGKETLWKWWRTHIDRNNGLLVLYHPGMDLIHGLNPSHCVEKANITVPKIVDDMQQFVKCLGEIKFPDFFIDLSVGNVETKKFHNLNKTAVKPKKLLPLAEELCQNSVKRINFEISKKKPAFLAASNRITIKEFASIRNLTGRTTRKLNLDIPSEPKASTSSTFYSYGEQINPSSIHSFEKPRGPPLGDFTLSKQDSKEVEEQNTRRSSHDNVIVKSHKETLLKSAGRLGKKSSSKKTVSKRMRKKSSSSSDGSHPRERRRKKSSSSSDRYHHKERRWHKSSSSSDRSHPRERRRKKSSSSSDLSHHKERRRHKSSSSSDQSHPREQRWKKSSSSSDRSHHKERRRHKSSSSSDRSHRDQSSSRRNRHRGQSSTDRSRFREWSPPDRWH